MRWLDETGFLLLSTSINGFEDFDRAEDLLPLEKEYEQISHQANYIEERYFPGFFTVLAQKHT